MKNLIIIGARGYGREVYNWAIQNPKYNKDWIVKGFLDDKKDALDAYLNYPPIIDSVENYLPQSDDLFLCALGEVIYKKKYIELILSKKGIFTNLIHPNTVIHQNSILGIGCIICPYVIISNDVTIGEFVTIQSFSDIGHDAVVGNFVHINAYTFVGGYGIVKDFATLNTGAKVLPKKVIGEGAVVGAGSIVIRNVKPYTTVFGNPAKILSL